MVAYADDLAAVVMARDETDLVETVNLTIRKINQWTQNHGLQIAPEKTEAILLVGRKRHRPVSFTCNDKIITPLKNV